MTEPTDAELTECYKAANGEDVGKAQPLTTQRIFRAMRAAIAKWGTPPAVAGDTIIEAPSSYQWITEPGSVEHFGIPGQVRKVVANVATPQPTQAQAGAVPLTDGQILLLRLANSSLFHLFERWNKKEIPHYQLMDEMGQVIEHVIRRTVIANGIKGGQHGADT